MDSERKVYDSLEDYMNEGFEDQDIVMGDNDVSPFVKRYSFKAIRFSRSQDARFVTVRQEDGINIPVGEASSVTSLVNTFKADAAPSGRVFRSPEFIGIISSLGRGPLSMILWICLHMGRGKDYIFIDPVKYCFEMGITEKTYYVSRAKLVRVGILARKKNNVYWVNANYLFPGNRLDKFPDSVEVVATVEPKKKQK